MGQVGERKIGQRNGGKGTPDETFEGTREMERLKGAANFISLRNQLDTADLGIQVQRSQQTRPIKFRRHRRWYVMHIDVLLHKLVFIICLIGFIELLLRLFGIVS